MSKITYLSLYKVILLESKSFQSRGPLPDVWTSLDLKQIIKSFKYLWKIFHPCGVFRRKWNGRNTNMLVFYSDPVTFNGNLQFGVQEGICLDALSQAQQHDASTQFSAKSTKTTTHFLHRHMAKKDYRNLSGGVASELGRILWLEHVGVYFGGCGRASINWNASRKRCLMITKNLQCYNHLFVRDFLPPPRPPRRLFRLGKSFPWER